MIPDGMRLYNDPDGVHYVGLVGSRWYRWPAERDGWKRRAPCDPPELAGSFPLDARLAKLAAQLSGVRP